jgi:hypothetical protein
MFLEEVAVTFLSAWSAAPIGRVRLGAVAGGVLILLPALFLSFVMGGNFGGGLGGYFAGDLGVPVGLGFGIAVVLAVGLGLGAGGGGALVALVHRFFGSQNAS